MKYVVFNFRIDCHSFTRAFSNMRWYREHLTIWSSDAHRRKEAVYYTKKLTDQQDIDVADTVVNT